MIHIVTRKSIKSILTNIKQAYVLPPQLHLPANIVYAQERTTKIFYAPDLLALLTGKIGEYEPFHSPKA